VPVRLRTRSAAHTRALGAALAASVVPGDVVLLAGDLGAGKTTLVQGFAAGLGITEPVTSPTFTLVRAYRCPSAASPSAAPPSLAPPSLAPQSARSPRRAVRTLLHADVYRLDRLGEVVDLDLGELVEDDAVCVVEWGDVAAPALGDTALIVTLAPGDDDDERVVVLEPGPSWGPGRPPLDALAASDAGATS
jgi:tRNA threonylcarbamoyladenosine biosynthesis protein TsaE